MAAKIRIKDLDEAELTGWLTDLGEKPFRARQVRKWLFQAGARSFEEMTDISRDLRGRLGERADIVRPRQLEVLRSEDGTRKYLWELADGGRVESVLIPERDHLTLCLSSQVGCRMGCRFCRTAKLGFKRNLAPSEIIDQYLGVREGLEEGENLTNLVFMGMGEPLDNFDGVTRALKVLTEPGLVGLARRHLSVSTVGVVPRLPQLAEAITVGLTVSLGAADDKTRDRLMPVNRRWPLAELHRALAAFPLPQRRRITIAYVLLKDVNDGEEYARNLTRFLHGLKVKINLIPFNSFPGAEFEPSTPERTEAFKALLERRNYTVIIRKSKGRDVAAACGQLAGQSAEGIGQTGRPN